MFLSALQTSLLTIQNEVCHTGVNIYRAEANLHQLRSNLTQLHTHTEEIKSNLDHLRGTKMKIQRLLSSLHSAPPFVILDLPSTSEQSPSTNPSDPLHRTPQPITSNTVPLLHFHNELRSVKVSIKGYRAGMRTTLNKINLIESRIRQLEHALDTLYQNLQRHHKIEKDTIHLLTQKITSSRGK